MRLIAVLFVANVVIAGAQAPAVTSAAFDVASVKPNNSGSGPSRLTGSSGQFTATNVTVRQLVQEAFGINPFELQDAPDWTDRERFDVIAKAPDASDVHRDRLRALLAERFQLRAHREIRELPVYALVRVRDGAPDARLQPVAIDCDALQKSGAPRPPLTEKKGPPCGALVAPFRISSGGITMAALTQTLSHSVGRLVVDRTSLPGRYAFELEHAPDPLGRGDVGPADGASLFTALQEQLGLRLESTRARVDVVVIDSVGRPTPD